jgi:hypothetical protein
MSLFGFSRLAGAAAFGAALAFTAVPALADGLFDGKTVRLIINSKPGGGTDASARQIGALLIDHMPGKPQIVFQNLPGGGGIKANNYFFAKTKPDGLTVLAGSRTQVSPYKLRHRSVKYDPGKYRFVGGTARLGTIVLINKDPKIQARLMDKTLKPVAFGAIDGERTGDHAAVWAMEYLGNAAGGAARRGRHGQQPDRVQRHAAAQRQHVGPRPARQPRRQRQVRRTDRIQGYSRARRPAQG